VTRKTTSLRALGKYQLDNLLAVIFDDELIPILVLLYCVLALFDGMFVEEDPCLHGFWVYGSETSL